MYNRYIRNDDGVYSRQSQPQPEPQPQPALQPEPQAQPELQPQPGLQPEPQPMQQPQGQPMQQPQQQPAAGMPMGAPANAPAAGADAPMPDGTVMQGGAPAYGTMPPQGGAPMPGNAPIPGAVPAPGGAAATAPKPGLNSRAVLIGLIVIAAIVVIAIIVGVVTCGGGSKVPNIGNLVGDKSEQVVGTLDKLSKGKVGGNTFFTANDEMRDLIKKAGTAFGSDEKELKELKDSIQKMNPWDIAIADSESTNLSLDDVKNGTDPTIAEYETLRVLEKPKAEDIAKIAAEAFNYDKIIVGSDESGEYFAGMARNSKQVAEISAYESDGIYMIQVYCGQIDELENGKDIEEGFNDLYDNPEEQDLHDVYRK